MSGEPTQLPPLGNMLRMTFEKWYNDNIPRHAAALAFYSLFAVAPILLLAVELLGLLYGHEVAEAQILAQVEYFVNSPETAALVQTLLINTLPSSASWWVTAGFVIALLYGASSVFGELQIVLNMIWSTPFSQSSGIWGIIFERLLAVLMVVLVGLLIFFVVVMAVWLTAANNWATTFVNLGAGYATWSYLLTIFLLLTAVFALIYKFIPNTYIAWHDVLIGAAATAFLISITRLLISWYFSYSRISTMFGAASALVIILLWVYYSSQIFFLGAEFTYIYSRTYGVLWQNGHMPERANSAPVTTVDLVQGNSNQHAVDVSEMNRGKGEVGDQPDPVVYQVAQAESKEPILLEVDNIDMEEISTDEVEADEIEADLDEASTPTPLLKRFTPRFKRPQFGRNPAPILTEDSAPKPEEALVDDSQQKSTLITSFWERFAALRQRLAQLASLPIRLTRPLREIIVAIGVIGALSLAALVGIPWRRRRHNEVESPTTHEEI